MPHPPRPPSIDHGIVSFLWGAGLGLFIWLGLRAVGISQPTAVSQPQTKISAPTATKTLARAPRHGRPARRSKKGRTSASDNFTRPFEALEGPERHSGPAGEFGLRPGAIEAEI